MFGPQRQGGGGGEFVNLAGLFTSKKGGLYGRLEGSNLGAVIDKMIEASEQGMGIVFFVNPAKSNSDRGPTANLSMSISRPQPANGAGEGRRNWRSEQPQQAPPIRQQTAAPTRSYKRAVPKQEEPEEVPNQEPSATEDEQYDKFLASFKK